MSRRSRSRSRSPKRDREERKRREDRDRDRERKRDRKDRERKRRHRSSSSEGSQAEPHQLGSIFREERRRRERNESPKLPPPPPPPPSDPPVDTSIPFDVSTLNEPTKKWLEEKIVEQVSARVHQLEAMMAEKATSARNEMEKMLRAQIEAEMAVELAECKKRDEESRKKCKQLEAELERKVLEAEESRKKFVSCLLQLQECKYSNYTKDLRNLPDSIHFSTSFQQLIRYQISISRLEHFS